MAQISPVPDNVATIRNLVVEAAFRISENYILLYITPRPY